MVEVMKIMATSFRRFHAHTAALSAPDPAAGHCKPTPLPETPGHSEASLGQSLLGSLLLSLGPGVHKDLFVLSKSLFPQSCVSSGSSMVGLMATSSKRAYAIPKSTAPRAPAPVAGHCWPILPQETFKHSSGSVSVRSLGSGVHKVFWALWASLASMEFDSRYDFALPTIFLGLLLCPWMWNIFLLGSNIFLLTVVNPWVVILEFSQEKMSSRPSTPPSSGHGWMNGWI